MFPWLLGIAKGLFETGQSIFEAARNAIFSVSEVTGKIFNEGELQDELQRTILQETELQPLSSLELSDVIPELSTLNFIGSSKRKYRALFDIGYFDQDEIYHSIGKTTQFYDTAPTLSNLYADGDTQLEIIMGMYTNGFPLAPSGSEVTIGTVDFYKNIRPIYEPESFYYSREGD